MKRAAAYALVAIAAAAKILLQMAAMPPYAGLDEIYHVAYLSYVRSTHRAPRMGEPSVPAYLASSIAGDPRSLPPWVNPTWPRIVQSRRDLLPDRHLTMRDAATFAGSNYEAQQPSFYYRIVAPLAALRSPLYELRVWRLVSALAALVTILAVARIGEQFFGLGGILAAALLASFPTWQTLVTRASNDALACALIALALVASLRNSHWLVEALLWAAACATKLYAWPLLVALPVIWHQQRARRTRVIAVSAAVAISIALTIADLHSRTNNPLGLFAFDVPSRHAAAVPIAYGEMLKVLIATAVWTSGQLGDALRPLAIVAYVVPVVLLVVIARSRDSKLLRICSAAVVAFAIAQAINAIGYIRQARAAGIAMPAGGKEGWYWYALAPLLVVAILAPAVKRFPVAITVWLVAWDVLITEGAWFHDYAGVTSPVHGTLVTRWGPLFAPFTADLTRVAVGPLASHFTLLRVIHVAALLILLEFVRGTRDPQRDHPRVAQRETASPAAAAASVGEASR